jgi:ABC-type multidrug transport system fused ATPase/permease subunit
MIRMNIFNSAKFLLSNKYIFLIPMVIIFLISSALDVINIALIGGYIGIIIDSSLLQNLRDKFYLFEFFKDFSSEEILLIFGFILIAATVTKFIFIIFTNYLIYKFANLEQAKIQKMIIRSHLYQEYEKFILSKNSDSLASISNYANSYKNFISNALQFLSAVIIIIAAFILLAFVSFEIVLLMISILIFVFSIYNFFLRKKINTFGQNFTDGSSELIQGTQEAADGLKEIKTLGVEKIFINTVSNAANKIAKGHIGSNIVALLPRNIMELILICFVVAFISISIFYTQSIESSLVVLGTFAAAMIRIAPMISQLQIAANAMAFESPSVKKLARIIQEKETEHHGDFDKLMEKSSKISEMNSQQNFEQLKLENVSYTYPKSTRMSIQSANIEINKGDYVGIIGPSGSGKTTLVDIILGFLHPTTGTLKLNNVDAHKDIKKLLMHCAYLPQDIFLINGTLKENITMQNADICNEKMADVIKSSNLEDLLHDLPDGIDTHLGDKGIRLSGGQKQRVSIARALYFNREILVMDESTSALDSKTEEIFIDNLVKLKKKKTIISIAHRVSTLKNCNKIYTFSSS